MGFGGIKLTKFMSPRSTVLTNKTAQRASGSLSPIYVTRMKPSGSPNRADMANGNAATGISRRDLPQVDEVIFGGSSREKSVRVVSEVRKPILEVVWLESKRAKIMGLRFSI
jgi:hypothetical protein